MAMKRIILEMGSGISLHGRDYTKAAVRAVEDAIHHANLTLVRSLGLDPDDLEIEVHLGAQDPARIDKDAVAACLPFGRVTVLPVKGGLNVRDEASGRMSVTVDAGVVVRMPVAE